MANKTKWRMGGRKPSNSSGENDTTGTTTPTADGQELVKTPSRLRRTLTDGLRRFKRSKEPEEPAHLNRPFTQQNLEHQKILNSFAFNWGRKSSHGCRSSMSGISPSASRNASVDSSHIPPHHGDRREARPRVGNSFAGEAPRETEEESINSR